MRDDKHVYMNLNGIKEVESHEVIMEYMHFAWNQYYILLNLIDH